MKSLIKVALRNSTKAPSACTLQDEELLQIIEELLNMKDAEFTDDECDSSSELEFFNFTL